MTTAWWIAAGLLTAAFVIGVVVISALVAGAREDRWIDLESKSPGDADTSRGMTRKDVS